MIIQLLDKGGDAHGIAWDKYPPTGAPRGVPYSTPQPQFKSQS